MIYALDHNQRVNVTIEILLLRSHVLTGGLFVVFKDLFYTGFSVTWFYLFLWTVV